MRMNNPDREMMNLDALDPTDEKILVQEQELERDAQLLGNEYTLEAVGRKLFCHEAPPHFIVQGALYMV